MIDEKRIVNSLKWGDAYFNVCDGVKIVTLEGLTWIGFLESIGMYYDEDTSENIEAIRLMVALPRYPKSTFYQIVTVDEIESIEKLDFSGEHTENSTHKDIINDIFKDYKPRRGRADKRYRLLGE